MQGFTKLQSTKNNIKQAIINKGVPVASSDTFASYAQKIMNIVAGGDTPAEQAYLRDTIERDITDIEVTGISNIGEGAFQSCTNLTTVNFPNVTNIGNNAFQDCTNLPIVNFPNVTDIGRWAFQNCTKLSTANFPNVTNMSFSFQDCTNLKRLELGVNQVCTLSNVNAFNNSGVAAGTGYIYVPLNLVDSYKAASNWVTYKEQIRALPDPTQLKTLTINNNVLTATYTYIINGVASAVTGNVLTNIPKYSVIEYIIEADGYNTVKGSILLEDNATIDVTMTIPSWHSFTQPVLSANGTLGGEAFAVAGAHRSSNYAWYAFDASGTTYFRPASDSYDLIFYNPNPLKVSQLVLTYSSATYSDYPTTILSVSDDNVTWTQLKSFTTSSAASQTLAVDSSTGYLYYKITFTRGTNVRLKNCDITAQEYS